MTLDELSRIANRLRLDVVETVHLAGDGHPDRHFSNGYLLFLCKKRGR